MTCWCGSEATVLVDSDSMEFRDGMPVCDEHDTGDRPEMPISAEAIKRVFG